MVLGVPSEEYNPMEVAKLLNKFTDKIIAVKGNCDSEVDQMMLDFSIEAAHSIILCNGRRLFLTHGHIYNEDNLPKLTQGCINLWTYHNKIEKRKGFSNKLSFYIAA